MLAVSLLAGCHSGSKSGEGSPTAASYKTYALRGKVVSTNPATGEVTVAHQAIPGYMEAMTMPYKVQSASVLGELHPGDVITADLEVSQSSDADVFLDHIVVVAQGKPDYKPASSYHVPTAGDAVPNFALKNQDNRIIHLDQFHGQNLLITFIYTRCPLPNFCPLVTRHFAEIAQRLQANDPAVYAKTHLLCISFDPENDTPARLRAYGATYIGSDAKNAFDHWDFAIPQKQDELDKMAHYFDVGLTRGPDSAITHTLSTTLVGPDGKVVQFYPGNDWTVDQVLSDLKQHAQHS